MSSGIWVAASGAVARLTQLETTANNVANATTPAYKADDAVFQEHLINALHGGKAVDEMRLVRTDEVRPDMRAGPHRVTNRPLDVAIQGDAFFAVRAPTGERYTRAGNFEVAPDGRLTTADGLTLLNEARRPIRVNPAAQEVQVDRDGGVRVNGDPIARLRVVSFADNAGLQKEGNLLFRATDASGPARRSLVPIESGVLEEANFSVVSGMTQIVSATRAFDALGKVIEAFKDADSRAATDLMRS